MTIPVSLTPASLVTAMKKAGLATKKDLNKINGRLDRLEKNMATKAELAKVTTNMVAKDDLAVVAEKMATKAELAVVAEKMATKAELAVVAEKMATKDQLVKLERSLKRRMGKHRSEIMTAVSSFAMTVPSKREFNELRDRVYATY